MSKPSPTNISSSGYHAAMESYRRSYAERGLQGEYDKLLSTSSRVSANISQPLRRAPVGKPNAIRSIGVIGGQRVFADRARKIHHGVTDVLFEEHKANVEKLQTGEILGAGLEARYGYGDPNIIYIDLGHRREFFEKTGMNYNNTPIYRDKHGTLYVGKPDREYSRTHNREIIVGQELRDYNGVPTLVWYRKSAYNNNNHIAWYLSGGQWVDPAQIDYRNRKWRTNEPYPPPDRIERSSLPGQLHLPLDPYSWKPRNPQAGFREFQYTPVTYAPEPSRDPSKLNRAKLIDSGTVLPTSKELQAMDPGRRMSTLSNIYNQNNLSDISRGIISLNNQRYKLNQQESAKMLGLINPNLETLRDVRFSERRGVSYLGAGIIADDASKRGYNPADAANLLMSFEGKKSGSAVQQELPLSRGNKRNDRVMVPTVRMQSLFGNSKPKQGSLSLNLDSLFGNRKKPTTNPFKFL